MSNSNEPNLGQVSKLNTFKDAVTEKLIFSLENRVRKSKVSRKSSLFLLKKDLNVANITLPGRNHLFKVNNRNTRKKCEIS